MAGWGNFLGGLMDKLPIQGRIERWCNERENLLKEKQTLKGRVYDINKEEDRKKMDRLTWVLNRIIYLEQLLRNKS